MKLRIVVIDEDQYSQRREGCKKEENFNGKKGDGGGVSKSSLQTCSEYLLDRALVSNPNREEPTM